MNPSSIFLSILAMGVFIFAIVYSVKNKGRENFFLLGICFFVPTILFIITLFFAYFPKDKIAIVLKGLLVCSAVFSLYCSINYFAKYFKDGNK